MATVDSVSKEVSLLAQRVVALETELRVWNKIIAGLSGAAVLAGLAALGWCYHLGTKVAVIESGGNTKLVTELTAPRSKEQLQANLSTVTAQIQSARANGIKSDKKKVQALSGAMARVVQHDPEVAETWQAASALISYRVPPEKGGNPAICQSKDALIDFRLIRSREAANSDLGLYNGLVLKNCTLVLDEAPAFVTDKMFVDKQGKLAVSLDLRNVHVVYRGGQIVPVQAILFTNCTFEFQMYTRPPVLGERLTETLLASTDPAHIDFKGQGAS